MGTIIKRNGIEHLNLVKRGERTIDSASLGQGMLTDDTVKYSVRSNSKLDVKINDTIEVFGNTYRINTLPTFKKTSNTEYSYEIEAQGLMYDLLRCKFFNADGEGFKTTTDFPLIGNLEVFLVAIRNNMHRFSANWEIGNFASTETKMITFGDDTCLSALQKICQEFKTDFWVKTEGGKFKIHTGAFGSTLPIDFEYGKGKGLYNLSRKNVDSNGIVNRLYVNGGTDNIPAGYRAFSDALKFSDAGYIEDVNLIAEMGLIEGSIDFPDIYPKRTGVVSAVGSSKFKFHDSSMDFDLNEKEADGSTKYLIAGTSAKVHFNTGNLAGYEFEIKKGGYNHTTKEFEIIPFTNQTGQKFPDEVAEAFQIGVGDEYVLLDIVMPQTYITNAEAELLTKANEQFALLKTVKVSYDLEVDPDYIKNLSTPISIGDYVRVKDANLGIDKVIRVQAITRNFITSNTPTPYNYKITLADSYEISFASQMVLDITEVKNVISVTNLGDINLSKLGYKTTEELRNLVFDTDGYFDAENIKPFSIQTNMLTVGAQSQQLSCSVVFLVNNAGNPNQVETKAGALFSQTFNKTWMIAGSVQTIPDNNSRYVYAKCSKNGTSGTIYFTQAQIKFDEDVNDYYFLLGILHTVTEGVRVLSITIGTTTINGGLIRTGIISSLDGQTYFNLNTGEIKGKITFTNDSPAFQQMNDAIVIGGRNLMLHSKGEFGFAVPITTTEPLKIGDKYTLSFDVIGNVNGSIFLNNSISLTYDTSGTGWRRKNVTFTFVKNDYLSHELYPHIYGADSVKNVKLEKGTKATDWTPAPEDVNEQITAVQTYATTVNNLVSDIANDNKITPSEKQQLKQEYDIIVAEKPQVTAQATPYPITAEKTSYDNAYNNLVTYVNPLIVNLNNTSDVDGVTLRSRFTSYYTAKVNLLKAITDSVNNDLSAVFNEMENLQNSVNQEIADVTEQVNNLEGYVDGAFSDGIINQAEAVAIEKYINQINTEKSDIDNKYNQIYNDSYLSGTPKTNLATDYNNYVSSHTNLINSINTAISDGATTPAEKADVDSKFSSYRLALGVLTTRFQEAIKAIETATVNAIQIGGRNLIIKSDFTKVENAYGIFSINGGVINPTVSGLHFATSAYGHGVYCGISGLQVGKEYVLSIWTKATYQESTLVQLGFNNGTSKLVELPTSGSEYIKTSVVIIASLVNDAIIFYNGQAGINNFYLKYIKLELGNKGTDYTPAPEDIDAQFVLVKAEITDVDNKLTNLQDNFTDFASDGVINIAEAKALKNIAQTLNNEKADVNQKYLQAYNDVNLTDKTPLQTAWNNYNTSHADLLYLINGYTGGDRAITPDELNSVNSYFTYYRNALSALSAALEAALKAISIKQIDNIQVGGRNLMLNSKGEFGVVIPISTKEPLKVGEKYTLSFDMIGNPSGNIFLNNSIVLNYDTSGTGWRRKNVTFTFVKNDYGGRELYPHIYGADSVKNVKLEIGNKATDWTPAPEDVDAAVTQANQNAATALAQAQNAQTTAAAAASVTSFMQTTVDGNVVATGTLQVGDVNGANAGITGVTDRGRDSVRFYAGSNYAGKDTSAWSVSDNGLHRFHHPNGKLGLEIGVKDGEIVINGYHESGFKTYEMSPNRGLVNVSYIPESFSPQKSRYFGTTYNEESIKNTLVGMLTHTMIDYGPNALPDRRYNRQWKLSNDLLGNVFLYSAGTHPNNEQYKPLAGYKANNYNRNENAQDGWYYFQNTEMIASGWDDYGVYEASAIFGMYKLQGGKVVEVNSIHTQVYAT
ncbi:hypothetical protein H0S70_07145 [Chryseobacterium manosquense]|uniref:Uncharacterized protein n=1 Tax=Chryseobacterium manosquense TaxID=2754694 RepID=A0A7H1DT74_9FLAO|nr:hypothetical protein [Chryseobacterium manosquense]QNS40182.1 hypothetical protein H0S70_07145 [Chryseobacterium manosquense]